MKYPILLEKTSDFNSMGLGALRGFVSLTIQRDRNAIPVLNGTYDKDDELAPEIKEGRIIVATMGPKEEEQNQMFRILNVGGDSLNSFSIQATHVIGDLAYNLIKEDISMANATPTEAFDAIKSSLANPLPELKFTSDIQRVANLGWSFKDGKAVTNLLMGEDEQGNTITNTMQSLYQGEWNFNNYHLTFTDDKDPNKDTGIIIKYGRRLKSLSQDTNVDNTYNAILPYAFYNQNQEKDEGEKEDSTTSTPVQYIGTGSVLTYDGPFKNHKLNGTLQNGTYYHILKTVTDGTVNNDTWYKIDNNQWVDKNFFAYDKSKKYIVNPIKAKGTISLSNSTKDMQGLIVNYRDVGSVTYTGKEKVPLWSSPFNDGQASGKYLTNGTSCEIYRKAVTYSGMVWYCLSENNDQWIPSKFFSLQKTGNYATTSTVGILTIVQNNVVAMNLPNGGNKVEWDAETGSKWKITQIAQDLTGHTWYQIGSYIWILDNDSVSFENLGLITPGEDNVYTIDEHVIGKVPIYSTPTGLEDTKQYLSIGTQKEITAQAQNQNHIWYEIGKNQWVDSIFFDFSGKSDIAPGHGGNKSAIKIQSQQETVMLPELIVRSPFTDGEEQLRIKPVDFSSYGFGNNVNKLRMAASTYMKQNRIGYPTNSFTLEYQQICNEVDLYDLVKIHYEKLDILDIAQVNSVVWNVLSNEFTTITLGKLPIAPEHILNTYVQAVVKEEKEHSESKNNLIFEQLKRENADQNDNIKDLSDKVEKQDETVKNNIEHINNAINSNTQTLTNMKTWISGQGDGLVYGYPNWEAPIELRVKNSDGGYVLLSNQGLANVNSNGEEIYRFGESNGNIGIMINGLELTQADIAWIHEQRNKGK